MFVTMCDGPQGPNCVKSFSSGKGGCFHVPSGWYELRFGSYSAAVVYHFCPVCRAQLKIPATEPDKSVGEHLVEILEEIAHTEAENVISNG